MKGHSIALSDASHLRADLDRWGGLVEHAEKLVGSLTRYEMYQISLDLIDTFRLSELLSFLFQEMTKKCIECQIQSATFGSFQLVEDSVAKTDECFFDFHGHLSHADERWGHLSGLLKQYQGVTFVKNEGRCRASNYQYYCVVAETMLSIDRRLQLPFWLVQILSDHDPASLLRIYMKYCCLEEACALSVKFYQVPLFFRSVPMSDSIHSYWQTAGGSEHQQVVRWIFC